MTHPRGEPRNAFAPGAARFCERMSGEWQMGERGWEGAEWKTVEGSEVRPGEE